MVKLQKPDDTESFSAKLLDFSIKSKGFFLEIVLSNQICEMAADSILNGAHTE